LIVSYLDRETALRMLTEKVTWFSNEEGKKGQIAAGQFAYLIVPDRDFFSCPEGEMSFISADLTVVGGKVVHGARDFARLDERAPLQAMPDWSPVRTFKGYGVWGEPDGAGKNSLRRAEQLRLRQLLRRPWPRPAGAWSSKLPVADLCSFWRALGCACWAV
jgi:hypothetical protein